VGLVLFVYVAARLVDYAVGGNLPLTTAAEILAGAAALLAARVAAVRTWQARRELAKEASHELRAPLTVLHGYVSMVEDGTLPNDQARDLMPLLAGKTRELNERIDGLLARMHG